MRHLLLALTLSIGFAGCDGSGNGSESNGHGGDGGRRDGAVPPDASFACDFTGEWLVTYSWLDGTGGHPGGTHCRPDPHTFVIGPNDEDGGAGLMATMNGIGVGANFDSETCTLMASWSTIHSSSGNEASGSSGALTLMRVSANEASGSLEQGAWWVCGSSYRELTFDANAVRQ